MKRNPEINIATVVADMLKGEHLPVAVDDDGHEVPTSDMQRLEARAALVRIGQDPDKIRTKCIACGADVPVASTEICVCGGMVCASCQASEEDGVCEHEPHSLSERLREARARDAPAAEPLPQTVADAWRQFRAHTFEGAPDAVMIMPETVFYAGVYAALMLFSAAMRKPSPKEAREAMDALTGETEDWIGQADRTFVRRDDDGTVQ